MTKVLIKILVDRSGSMGACRGSAESAIEEFLNERRKEKELKQEVSLDDFDTEYETVYNFTEISNAPRYTLTPRGRTALYDAIMKAVQSLESHKPDKGKAKRFLVIMTDGYENASKEATKELVKKTVEKKQADGWTVIYLGANQDAVAVGQTLGVPVNSSLTYDVNSTGASVSALRSVSRLISTRSKGGFYNFTSEDRERSMDE
jgi:Mg-chelatase subunit ChlD